MSNPKKFPKRIRYSKKIFCILSTILFLQACGKLSDQVSVSFKPLQDFKRSEIINNGPAPADGQSELLVVVQLMNSDGSPVKLFKPSYDVVSGAGVTAQECTTSNSHGVSTCVLKASIAGTKRISVTNIKVKLEGDILFTTPSSGKSLSGLISAGQTQSQGNFKLIGTIGNQEVGLPKTSGAFKLFGGVQGEAFSR